MDLVYRRGETAWVRQVRARGLRAVDGLPMLIEQGALAFERWFGEPPDRRAMWASSRRLNGIAPPGHAGRSRSRRRSALERRAYGGLSQSSLRTRRTVDTCTCPGETSPMPIRVGINGFGRIGRQVLRAALEQDVADIEIVAVNDLTDGKTMAHLFKYDSVQGTFEGEVSAAADGLHVDDRTVRVTAEKDPAALPWKELGVDLVLESTGRFPMRRRPGSTLRRGAKGRDLGARQGRGPDGRDGRQQWHLRQRPSPRGVERVVHHQLPGPNGEGDPGRVRIPARVDGDDSQLHQRPVDPRFSAQGPAPRARRRGVDHPDDDGRREGDRPGDPRGQGQDRRRLDARADT